ncbi:MAG TPA: glucose-6-phosphate dehydrogenase (coenzyme-F420) [Chloroflexota bacterium]
MHDKAVASRAGKSLKLGYKASAEQFGPQALLDFSVQAERHGFDSVFTSDHFQPWRHTNGHAPNSLVWLGALGQRTERVLLGTSVLTPTFRYNPAVVAQAMATLACLDPGRVILGVGTGESMNEVPIHTEPWPEFKERYARLREAIALMKQLWSQDFVTFEGMYYRTHNATIYDRPSEPVKLFVAAGGPQMAKYAGRVADGMIATSGKGMDLYAEKLLPALTEGAEGAGRDPDSIEKMIEMKVSFDTDRNRAMRDTREWAALALPSESKVGVEDPREMERLAAGVADQAHRRWIVSTDPEEHIEQIRPYIELGFDHLVFHAPGADQSRFIELYGREILPRLRERWG